MTDLLARPEVEVSSNREAAPPGTTWTRGLSVLLISVVLLLPAVGLLRQSGQGQLMEEGMMILDPYRLVHGALAYRSFDYLWGPGGLWLPALVHSAFGWTEAVSRMIGLGYAVVGTFAVYALFRRWSEGLGVVAAVSFAFIDRMSDLPEYGAIALAVLALYFAYRSLIGRGGRARWFAVAAGLAAGGALLFRQDRGAGVALALLVVFWSSRARLRQAAAGFGVGAALFLAYGLWAGIGPTLRDILVIPLHVPAERHLPLPLGNWRTCLWMALVVVALGTDAYAGWRRRRINPSSPRGPVLLGATVFAASLIPEFLQRSDSGHLLVAGSMAVAVLPVALADLSLPAEGSVVPRGAALRYGLAAALVLGVAFYQEAVVPYLAATQVTLGMESPGTTTVAHDGRTFTYFTPDAKLVAALVTWVQAHTHPGETLFVGPADLSRTPYSDNSIPVLLPELRDSMSFPDMNPWVALHEGRRLAADVAAAHVLVLDQALDSWSEPNQSSLHGSQAANRVVARDFCLRATFGAYQVMMRCSPTGSGASTQTSAAARNR